MAGSLSSSLSKLQALNGIFSIYKRQGPTSADVLNDLKTALLREAGVTSNPRKRKKQCMKMGHGGTLDSSASGVLVVGVGNGTKMLSQMLAGSKKYVAVGELGRATDTLDASGTVTEEKDFKHISRADLEEKLKTFTGDIMQVPPLYSALKKDGQRLSVLLKQGHSVEAKPARAVTVYSLTLQDFSPPVFTLDIECGGGFYVRSLVDDLGKALESCAHVKSLTRTKQGQFTLEDVLHQQHWTLEHVLKVLQPCPGTKHPHDGPGTKHPADAPGTKHDCSGTRHAPDGPGTRHAPDGPGTRHAPDSPGTRHAPDSPGTRHTPDSPGTRHTPDSPGKNGATSPHPEACPTENKRTSPHSDEKTTSVSSEQSTDIHKTTP